VQGYGDGKENQQVAPSYKVDKPTHEPPEVFDESSEGMKLCSILPCCYMPAGGHRFLGNPEQLSGGEGNPPWRGRSVET